MRQRHIVPNWPLQPSCPLRLGLMHTPFLFLIRIQAMQIINYSNSPVGTLPGGTSITNQYSSLGVIHDGSTTTPPGPPGMSMPRVCRGSNPMLAIRIHFFRLPFPLRDPSDRLGRTF